jgi:hypothetical protein
MEVLRSRPLVLHLRFLRAGRAPDDLCEVRFLCATRILRRPCYRRARRICCGCSRRFHSANRSRQRSKTVSLPTKISCRSWWMRGCSNAGRTSTATHRAKLWCNTSVRPMLPAVEDPRRRRGDAGWSRFAASVRRGFLRVIDDDRLHRAFSRFDIESNRSKRSQNRSGRAGVWIVVASFVLEIKKALQLSLIQHRTPQKTT